MVVCDDLENLPLNIPAGLRHDAIHTYLSQSIQGTERSTIHVLAPASRHSMRNTDARTYLLVEVLEELKHRIRVLRLQHLQIHVVRVRPLRAVLRHLHLIIDVTDLLRRRLMVLITDVGDAGREQVHVRRISVVSLQLEASLSILENRVNHTSRIEALPSLKQFEVSHVLTRNVNLSRRHRNLRRRVVHLLILVKVVRIIQLLHITHRILVLRQRNITSTRTPLLTADTGVVNLLRVKESQIHGFSCTGITHNLDVSLPVNHQIPVNLRVNLIPRSITTYLADTTQPLTVKLAVRTIQNPVPTHNHLSVLVNRVEQDRYVLVRPLQLLALNTRIRLIPLADASRLTGLPVSVLKRPRLTSVTEDCFDASHSSTFTLTYGFNSFNQLTNSSSTK